MMNLNQIDLNKKSIIKTLNFTENFKRRILDLGIVPGIEIERILESPFKKISAYNIKGSLIAIRDIDASKIGVEYV